ncbi:MAG: hypothetical protein HOP37_04240 [Cyclobacteriaceae bacterium]|nr:hypothetical protein [Cyclobacteriaceae bacterium]
MKGLSMVCFKRVLALSFLFCVSAVVVYAQPGDPGGDPDVPITGIEILIGAGGALGIKKMLKKRKKTT